MKAISRLLHYNEKYFEKLPEEALIWNDTQADYPVFIKEELLTPSLCDEIVEKLLSENRGRAATLVGEDINHDDYDAHHVEDKVRKTIIHEMEECYWAQYNAAVDSLLPEVEDFFSIDLVSREIKQVLGYEEGGHYIAHADNGMPEFDADRNVTGWTMAHPHRKVSTIFFMTEGVSDITGQNQCIGGNLGFPYLFDSSNEPFLVEPKKGMFIVFPSNPIFIHRVHEVVEGYRAVIVTWFDGKQRRRTI